MELKYIAIRGQVVFVKGEDTKTEFISKQRVMAADRIVGTEDGIVTIRLGPGNGKFSGGTLLVKEENVTEI